KSEEKATLEVLQEIFSHDTAIWEVDDSFSLSKEVTRHCCKNMGLSIANTPVNIKLAITIWNVQTVDLIQYSSEYFTTKVIKDPINDGKTVDWAFGVERREWNIQGFLGVRILFSCMVFSKCLDPFE